MVCVAAEEHRFLVTDALQGQTASAQVVLEPAPRNTAAAMALAALLARTGNQADPLLLFCPADHHIPDASAFADMVRQGVPAAEAGAVVVFGVVPSFPSSAYGYIQPGEPRPDGSRSVARFVEKPATGAAQALLLQGQALWNAGIFLARASTVLTALEQHAGDILAACEMAMASSRQESQIAGQHSVAFVRPETSAFLACRAQSFDHAVTEPLAVLAAQATQPQPSNPVPAPTPWYVPAPIALAVVPFQGQWSDVGSWNAVADLSEPDVAGNRVVGQGHALQASNTYIHALGRTVVALGTQDLLIIDTPDALLVAHRDSAEQMKDVVAHLSQLHRPEAAVHRKVARPWGWYDSIDLGERFQVKRIGVNPGASLSLQQHHHRAEHWIVVKGTAEVTRGPETFLLSENQSTYIPVGEVHRLRNPGKLALEMIEVQTGSYLGEDDIVRMEDTGERATPFPTLCVALLPTL